MKKVLFSACVVASFMLLVSDVSSAQGRGGRSGYRASSLNYGPGVRSYGFAPYGRYYQAPVVRSYPRGYYSGYGRSSFYGRYGNAYGRSYNNFGRNYNSFGRNYNSFNRSGFGGGYGNLGYPSPFGLRGGSGTQLRIGF